MTEWVCGPCGYGDHSSHDNGGKPWSGRSKDLDSFDCKTQPKSDHRVQCMCRANWPDHYAGLHEPTFRLEGGAP